MDIKLLELYSDYIIISSFGQITAQRQLNPNSR